MQVKDLKKQFMVIRESDELGECIVWNGKKKFFSSLKDAEKAIEKDKLLWTKNKPIVVNGMGIETERADYNFKYHIEWRWISKWEVL